jgi:hypothetical protein
MNRQLTVLAPRVIGSDLYASPVSTGIGAQVFEKQVADHNVPHALHRQRNTRRRHIEIAFLVGAIDGRRHLEHRQTWGRSLPIEARYESRSRLTCSPKSPEI